MTISKNILEWLRQIRKKFCDKFCPCQRGLTRIDRKKDGLSINFQHAITNRINESNEEQISLFGTILCRDVLSPLGYAIYMDKTNSRIVLLKNMNPELRKCEENSMVRIIFDILALLKLLEDKLLVYRLLPAGACDSVLYDAAEECIPVGDTFKLNATQTLSFNGEHWCIKENDIIIYQECFSFKEEIYDQLKDLLESLVYPTEELESYISYNYQSKEDYINLKSLERAKIANWIAILIGFSSLVIGPCINLLLNNKFGQTTLSEASIDSLVNAKQTMQIVRDTIIVPKQDTIKCIIIQDKTKQTKGGKK